jgi:hypothetical protein
MNLGANKKAIAKFQAATTPAAIRERIREGKHEGIPQTAHDIKVAAALELREELAKWCW